MLSNGGEGRKLGGDGRNRGRERKGTGKKKRRCLQGGQKYNSPLPIDQKIVLKPVNEIRFIRLTLTPEVSSDVGIFTDDRVKIYLSYRP